jgi:hypothetical protein
MNMPAWTICLAIIFLLGSGEVFTQSPRVMAQTAERRASDVPGPQGCGYADAGSVAILSGSEGDSQSGSNASAGSNQNDWVHAWMRKADEARASQPHFVSPMVTTHVMLVPQYRFDMSWQQDPSGGTITSNYGASHGLEIIPTSRLEVGLFQPPYLAHQSNVPDGFGDFSFQIKYRAWSAPEGRGDYFVGFFFAGSLPTGTPPNGVGHTLLSPTFAAAKGIGRGTFRARLVRVSLPAVQIF